MCDAKEKKKLPIILEQLRPEIFIFRYQKPGLCDCAPPNTCRGRYHGFSETIHYLQFLSFFFSFDYKKGRGKLMLRGFSI